MPRHVAELGVGAEGFNSFQREISVVGWMSGKIVRAELVCRIESGLLQIVGAQLLQARFYHAASALKLGERHVPEIDLQRRGY